MWTQRETGVAGGGVKTLTEKMATWQEQRTYKLRRTKDCQQTPDTRRSKDGFSPGVFRGRVGLLTP